MIHKMLDYCVYLYSKCRIYKRYDWYKSVMPNNKETENGKFIVIPFDIPGDIDGNHMFKVLNKLIPLSKNGIMIVTTDSRDTIIFTYKHRFLFKDNIEIAKVANGIYSRAIVENDYNAWSIRIYNNPKVYNAHNKVYDIIRSVYNKEIRR